MERCSTSSSPSSDLCTSCGLCCSGVVFDSIPFATDEKPHIVDLGFSPYEDPPGQLRFDLPCQHLQETRCGVYDRRPRTCAAFRCELLKKFEKGEVSRTQADERIAEVKKLIDEIRPMMVEAGGPITPKRWGALLEQWRTKAPSGGARPAEGQLVLELAKLHRLLDTHFRSPDQQVVKVKDELGRPG